MHAKIKPALRESLAPLLDENVERNFGFLLNDVARLMRTVYDRRMRSLGLTRSQWWVLTHLYRNDGCTQSALAEVLEVEKPTLGRLLDRLEANGWVRRVPDAQDRRAKRVFLADEAAPALKQMREHAAELRSEALAGVPVEQREHFVDLLLAIKGNLMASHDGETRAGAAARQ